MPSIYKNLEKGDKLKVGDYLDIPNNGEFKVTGIYRFQNKDFTVYCQKQENNKSYAFLEQEIARYKRPHLRLVK